VALAEGGFDKYASGTGGYAEQALPRLADRLREPARNDDGLEDPVRVASG
jgi:hypothetical protein